MPKSLGAFASKQAAARLRNPIFLRGIAWLHSFEYEQPESSFNQAAAADPSCGIAHWGAAMSLSPAVGAAHLGRARKRPRRCGEGASRAGRVAARERLYRRDCDLFVALPTSSTIKPAPWPIMQP
jgi:hypothetical protein